MEKGGFQLTVQGQARAGLGLCSRPVRCVATAQSQVLLGRSTRGLERARVGASSDCNEWWRRVRGGLGRRQTRIEAPRGSQKSRGGAGPAGLSRVYAVLSWSSEPKVRLAGGDGQGASRLGASQCVARARACAIAAASESERASEAPAPGRTGSLAR